jgi:hypothetical protein
MKFDVCLEYFILLPVLHQHGTAQNIADIPQRLLHKHGTITQITPDIPQTSLHKHGVECLFNEVYGMSEVICAVSCLCNEV